MNTDDHLFRCPSCGSVPPQIPSRDGSLRGEVRALVYPRGQTELDLLIDSMMIVQRVGIEPVVGRADQGDPAVLTGALGALFVTSVRLGVVELLDAPVPVWEFLSEGGYTVKANLAFAGTLLRVRLENHTDQHCLAVAVAHGRIAEVPG